MSTICLRIKGIEKYVCRADPVRLFGLEAGCVRKVVVICGFCLMGAEACGISSEEYPNSSVENEFSPRRGEIKVRKNEMKVRKNEITSPKNFLVPR